MKSDINKNNTSNNNIEKYRVIMIFSEKNMIHKSYILTKVKICRLIKIYQNIFKLNNIRKTV